MKHLYTKETSNFLRRKFINLETTTLIMHHLFQFHENTFNLRNFREIVTHNKKTSNYGLETVSYRAPFLWAKLPSEYKNTTSFSEFKTKTENWKGNEICPCRLCKAYLPNIGYVRYDRSMKKFRILIRILHR